MESLRNEEKFLLVWLVVAILLFLAGSFTVGIALAQHLIGAALLVWFIVGIVYGAAVVFR